MEDFKLSGTLLALAWGFVVSLLGVLIAMCAMDDFPNRYMAYLAWIGWAVLASKVIYDSATQED